MRDGHWRGLADWCCLYGMERDPVKLGERIFQRVTDRGGIFHLWGHGWELEACGLWAALEELLKKIGGVGGAEYVTNEEVLEARQAAGATADGSSAGRRTR